MALTVRLYSDFICPFCFVAEESSLVRLQDEFDVEVDWRGFELHPETPVGGIRVSDLFPEAKMPAMREFIKSFAARFDVEMDTPEHLPNTRRVLAIAELAREEGCLDAFRNAAMEAHWRGGKNLEDDADLRAIAARAGIDPEAALQAADDLEYQRRVDVLRAEASSLGVTGVPTFFIGDQCVVGCQPYAVITKAARRAGASSKQTDKGQGAPIP